MIDFTAVQLAAPRLYAPPLTGDKIQAMDQASTPVGIDDPVHRASYEEAMRRVARASDLNKISKRELLSRAYAGGLVDFNRPDLWRKDEIVSVLLDQEMGPAQPCPCRSCKEATFRD